MLIQWQHVIHIIPIAVLPWFPLPSALRSQGDTTYDTRSARCSGHAAAPSGVRRYRGNYLITAIRKGISAPDTAQTAVQCGIRNTLRWPIRIIQPWWYIVTAGLQSQGKWNWDTGIVKENTTNTDYFLFYTTSGNSYQHNHISLFISTHHKSFNTLEFTIPTILHTENK